VLADLRAWDESGKLLTDTSAKPKPLKFALDALPEPLRLKLKQQPLGSALQVWLPPGATQGWKFYEWPDDQTVRLELHLVGAVPANATVTRMAGRPPGMPKFDPPASTGPPQYAKEGPGGLRYLWLESGPEGSQPTASSRVTLKLNGYTVQGVVVAPFVNDQQTLVDLDKAPAGVAHVLSKMVPGDTVRTWFDTATSKALFPNQDSEVVVDVTLAAID
jgi:hypothetical protein